MKSYFCMPRLRGSSSSSRKSTRLITPMSLLDRFHEMFLRVIFLSALSEAPTVHENKASAGSGHTHRHHNHKSYYSYDPHHSEAVADCIEFIKKSTTADENRDSTASNSSIDGAPGPEVIIPLPVI